MAVNADHTSNGIVSISSSGSNFVHSREALFRSFFVMTRRRYLSAPAFRFRARRTWLFHLCAAGAGHAPRAPLSSDNHDGRHTERRRALPGLALRHIGNASPSCAVNRRSKMPAITSGTRSISIAASRLRLRAHSFQEASRLKPFANE
jgi:hypothetical protein